MNTTQPAPALVQPEASSFQAQREAQHWPKSYPQAISGHCVVDADFAAVLEERFGIPTAFILRALKGEPHQPAVALCRLATRYEEPNGTLLMLARKFGRGRARRQRTATTPPRGHGEVSGRPRTNTWRHGPGRYIAAPREVAPEGRDDVAVLDRIATRLGMS